MTSQSPRIYIYKITFEEVSYYYYGVKKEKKFDEYYMGTPVTHKWCWELYTPKKQILEIFEYSDEGWLEAYEVETRLIKPFYNADKWCLNENVGGKVSIETRRKGGKIGGKQGGKKIKELGLGIHGRTKEQMTEDARKGGKISGKINGKKAKELGLGIHGLSLEQTIENGRKGGKSASKITNSQKWKCTETGHITNAGALTNYQRKRGIDTTNRRRIS